ncbi:MAG: helix-turn-helix domain-containing protein [Clostridium sp.]|nr:helix-turn-helix domain-containing protein [Clostridium sp.]
MKKPALSEKDFLNPEEAIELFGLSRRKFYRLLKEGKKQRFTVLYGSRRLVIRKEFEKYLDENPQAKEGLKNGIRKNKGTA